MSVLDRYILRSYYRFYWDNFGINGHTVELELPVKINPTFSIGPHFRFYTQTAARYFNHYGAHSLAQRYYTSDYDLSRFHSVQLGAALRFTPFRKIGKRSTFESLNLRYGWYKRSDGLQAHMLSLLLDTSWQGLQK